MLINSLRSRKARAKYLRVLPSRGNYTAREGAETMLSHHRLERCEERAEKHLIASALNTKMTTRYIAAKIGGGLDNRASYFITQSRRKNGSWKEP